MEAGQFSQWKIHWKPISQIANLSFEPLVLFDWFSFDFHNSKEKNVLPAIQSSWGFSWRLIQRYRLDQRAKRREIDGRS